MNMTYPLTDCVTFLGVLLVFAASCIHRSSPSKVLFFNGMGEGSHYSTASGLAEELYALGHSVTSILGAQYRHRTEDPTHGDMFEFRIVENSDNIALEGFFEIATRAGFNGDNAFVDPTFAGDYGRALADVCEAVFTNLDFLRKLREEQFDLMVCDIAWPCTLILGDFLGVEKVPLFTSSSVGVLVKLLGGSVAPAVVPPYGLGYPQKMAFTERVVSVIQAYLAEYYLAMFADDTHSRILAKFDLPGFTVSLRDINAYIVATDDVFDYVLPRMPGHVSAAGLTIRSPAPLNEDLEAFVQSAGEEGVVIFSLGSYATHMPDRFAMMFREAFSRIPQKVIWQWKSKTPPESMPETVKCLDWLPQQDLLAHNRTKMLISHGGNNGVYEAIHYEVPILVLPLFADQFDVAQRIIEKGIGLRLDPREATSEQIVEKINTVLGEKRFQDNVSRLSAMYRDNPLTPRERAAFMIEHVLKFGSSHLRSPAHDLNFIQLYTIDVHAFILAVLVSIISIVYIVSRFVIKTLVGCFRNMKAKTD